MNRPHQPPRASVRLLYGRGEMGRWCVLLLMNAKDRQALSEARWATGLVTQPDASAWRLMNER